MTLWAVVFSVLTHPAALASAMQFASNSQAAVVSLALLPLSEYLWAKGPCLEAIEQANDFLATTKPQAARVGVVVPCEEMSTHNVVRRISVFAQEMQCERILLFLRGRTTVLLPPEVVKRLLEQVPCTLSIIRLPATDSTGPRQRLLQCDRLQRQPRYREEAHALQASPVSAGEMITLLAWRRSNPG